LINNRQNGRRRGRGQQQQRPQGGSQGSRDSGNRIDSRARGNATQLYEKYKNMASDAQRQGDRVNTEYYLQFADHYFRVMADQRGRYDDQSQPRRQQNDFDGDDDFGDEGEPIRAEEQSRGNDERGSGDANRQYENNRQYDGNRQQYDGNRQQSYEGNRQQRPERDDNRQRADGEDNRPREDSPAREEGRQRDDNRQRDGQQQGGRQRYNTPRAAEPRRDERPNGGSANADQQVTASAAPQPVVPPPMETVQPEASGEAPVAKRRGRPRKNPIDAGEQLGLDSSVLPPSIGAPAGEAEQAVDPDAPKPRRRRSIATPVEATTN
jgi:hypothetical protein